jgi:indoleacetamide hydrolase
MMVLACKETGRMTTDARGSEARDSLLNLSATAAVEQMRRGDITAEAYATALLQQAHRSAHLNAFRTLHPDKVLEAARAADRKRAAGQPLGRLHGLPIPVKDSVNTRDYPTSNGTRALRDFVPKQDADILAPLLAEGAIVMGKTNLHELSLGWSSDNETFGTVRNPCDQSRVPGGSSGGSAAAVAARMAPLAIAEDTYGSIRVPATCCGLAGLRPTFGRYSSHGIMSLTENKFDQVGPLARSVADLILFDSAVTGDHAAVAPTPLAGVRIGLSSDYFLAGLDRELEQIAREAFARLADAGAVLVEVTTPDIVKSAQTAIGSPIIACEAQASIGNFLQDHGTNLTFEAMFAQVGPAMRANLESFALPPNKPPREVYDAALVKRDQLKAVVHEWYREQNIQLLAFPPILCPPPRLADLPEIDINGQKVPFRDVCGRNIALGSCASLASLVLPVALTKDALPVGLEFDALGGRDRELLSTGLSIEAVLR